jgi:hypothetical protein
LVAKDILRVFYAPNKVFKDIIQKPGYLIPIILLILFVVAQVGTSYEFGSKSYIEQTVPVGDKADEWTENATLWQANSSVAINDNYGDYINGTQVFADIPDKYGNSSIEFKVSNSSMLQMALGNFDPQIDCGANGSKEVFFRVKIVSPDAKPENVTLALYSLSESDFFSHDLTNAFSGSVVNVWNNISVPVGSGDWSNSGSPSWENITILKLDFAWSSDSNITLLLDGLFFRGRFITQIEREGGLLPFLANLQRLMGLGAPFLFEWFLLTGLMYLLIKWLKGNVVWKPLMAAVGYALVITVVQAFIVAAVSTTLPDLHYPLEILANVSGEFEAAYEVLFTQITNINTAGYIVQVVAWVWLIALGAFITRAVTGDKKIAEQVHMGKATSDTAVTVEVTEFSWMKCLLVSGASLFLTIIVLGLFGIA